MKIKDNTRKNLFMRNINELEYDKVYIDNKNEGLYTLCDVSRVTQTGDVKKDKHILCLNIMEAYPLHDLPSWVDKTLFEELDYDFIIKTKD